MNKIINSVDGNNNGKIRTTIINNQEHFAMEDLAMAICDQIKKMPRETRPLVLAAEDARTTIDQLFLGIGKDMDGFRENIKKHLAELRGLKMNYLGEVNAIKKELAELRTFFVGADHDREIVRLREFVELCERLSEVKKSGILDAMADTIVKLA